MLYQSRAQSVKSPCPYRGLWLSLEVGDRVGEGGRSNQGEDRAGSPLSVAVCQPARTSRQRRRTEDGSDGFRCPRIFCSSSQTRLNRRLFPSILTTMQSSIQQFLALRESLLQERANIEAQIKEITSVLSLPGAAPVSPAPSSTPNSPATSAPKKKWTMSAASHAKMRAAAKARWAKRKGVGESGVAPAATKQPTRIMSEATKAKMSAAHKARWAKKRGKAGSVAAPVAAVAPAAKKAARVISPEAKARMIAGAKKRWAKLKAGK